MNSVDRVKKICKEKKIPLAKIERELGYANGYISQLKKGVFPADRLKEIAKYLGVSTEYLLSGREGDKYYLNEEAAKIAQALSENKSLQAFMEAAINATPEDLEIAYNMLIALKKKEHGKNI